MQPPRTRPQRPRVHSLTRALVARAAWRATEPRTEAFNETFDRLPQTSSLRNVIGPSGLQIEPPRFGAALPPPNIAGPLRLSRPRLMGDAAYPQFAPVLDSSTNLRVYFSRPGYFYLAPGEYPAHTINARAYGLLESAPAGVGRISSLLDASQIQTRYTFPVGNARLGPVLALGDNYLFAGGTYSRVAGNVLGTVNAGLVAWRNSVGLTGRFAKINLATGAFGMVGGSASRSMERTLQDLGVYSGSDAGRIAAHLGLPAQAVLRRVMWRTRRGVAGSVFAGAGHVMFAVQGRLGLSRRRERLLHTHMSQRRAHALLCRDRGAHNRVRNFLRTWGLRREPLALPQPRRPQSLRLGDEWVNTRSRTGIFGVSVGSLAAWLGTQCLRQGDREVRLRRLGCRLYELGATPTRIRGVGLFGASPLGPQLSLDVSTARTLRQAFTFDTSKPGAQRVMSRGLQKSLPGNLPDSIHARAPHRRVTQRYFSGVNERLPPGVKRAYAHAIEARELRFGGGIHLYLWPREWLPQGWAPGLTCHLIRGREEQAVHEGDRLTELVSRGSETRSELGWRGIRSERVAATTYRMSQTRGPLRLQGLHLDCVIARSCQPLKGLNRQVVERFNRYFSLHLGRLCPPASTRRREVALGRVLSVDEVDALTPYRNALCNMSQSAPVWHYLRACTAARDAGIAARYMRRLVERLSRAASVDACASILQGFVQRHALRGFTAIHTLAGGGAKTLSLDTTTQSYSETIKHAAKTQLRYYKGLRGCRGASDVKAAIERVDKAHGKLSQDPLISPLQRGQLFLQLRDARLSLTALWRRPVCKSACDLGVPPEKTHAATCAKTAPTG